MKPKNRPIKKKTTRKKIGKKCPSVTAQSVNDRQGAIPSRKNDKNQVNRKLSMNSFMSASHQDISPPFSLHFSFSFLFHFSGHCHSNESIPPTPSSSSSSSSSPLPPLWWWVVHATSGHNDWLRNLQSNRKFETSPWLRQRQSDGRCHGYGECS